MGILSIILLVIFVIVAVLLIFMVVIQNEGAEGLGGIFAGSSNTAFGSRSSNVMQRFTYVLGALFFVCAFFLAFLNKGSMGNVEKQAALQQTQTSAATEWWKGGSGAAQPGDSSAAGPSAPTAAQPAQSTNGQQSSGSGN